jgi:hypothetical protein
VPLLHITGPQPTTQRAKPTQEVVMFTARRIRPLAVLCALACAQLWLPATTIASHPQTSNCQQSTAWTPTKTQIRSALAQERYYMSFGRH